MCSENGLSEDFSIVKVTYKLGENTINLFDNGQEFPERKVTKFSYNNVNIYIRKKALEHEGEH